MDDLIQKLNTIIYEFNVKYNTEEYEICSNCGHPSYMHYWSGDMYGRGRAYDVCKEENCDCDDFKPEVKLIIANNIDFKTYQKQTINILLEHIVKIISSRTNKIEDKEIKKELVSLTFELENVKKLIELSL